MFFLFIAKFERAKAALVLKSLGLSWDSVLTTFPLLGSEHFFKAKLKSIAASSSRCKFETREVNSVSGEHFSELDFRLSLIFWTIVGHSGRFLGKNFGITRFPLELCKWWAVRSDRLLNVGVLSWFFKWFEVKSAKELNVGVFGGLSCFVSGRFFENDNLGIAKEELAGDEPYLT